AARVVTGFVGPVAASLSGATSLFVYDGINLAMQFDGAGSLTHAYADGPGADQPLADDNVGASMRWLLTDSQGSITDLVAASGAVQNHIQYSSFGQTLTQSNSNVQTIFGYTGQQTDSETGLNYYKARYNDPHDGQFISEDPIGFASG